ncbi:unnamed protein product, partial [Rotaria sp. Silwood2]
MGPNLT